MPESPLARLLLSQRLSGPALHTLSRLLQAPTLSRGLGRLLAQKLRLTDLRDLPPSARAEIPLDAAPLPARPPREAADARLGDLPLPGGDGPGWPVSAALLAQRFRQGGTSPQAVLGRLQQAAAGLAARHRASPVLREGPLAEAEARAATSRYKEGQPRSALDGVPVSIKEEAAVAGLPLRLGTRFLDEAPAPADAAVVSRLRQAGAVIAFQTAMTEYGASPLGISAGQSLPHNPHAPGHGAGGSSTGAAVAAATGLSPLSLGADGGGSIRIPAAMCGVFGLKPTFGRLPRTGDPYSGTMDHLGPLGVSVADLCAFLSVTAGPDPGDPASSWAPPGLAAQRAAWQGALGRGVSGLRIGVDDRLWQRADADVAHAGTAALDRLCEEGARRVAVHLPLAAQSPAIGYLTFGAEMLVMLRGYQAREEMGPDLRLSLSLLSHFPFDAYLDAQRLRGGLRHEVSAAFEDIDLLALPTTAAVAPALSEIEMQGLVDLDLLDAMVRFTFLANLTGLPALSAPVGFKQPAPDRPRLPIGLQLVGDAWDEATVLAAAAHLERIGAARVERPQVAVDLL